MIRTKCVCGKEYSVADDLIGQQARCRKCGALFMIGSAQQAPVPQVQKPRATQRRTPLPAAEVVRIAPRAAPLPAPEPSGFNLDLGALGPLDAPALGPPLGQPLGGATLGTRNYRRKKKSNVVLWLVFSGTGIAGVAIVAILIAALINVAGPARPTGTSSPTAYLPPNWSTAASLRVRNLLDRAASIPQLKAQIDQALATPIAQGFDPRDLEEVFIVADGDVGYLAATLSRPVDMPKLPGVSSAGDTHRGLPIYRMSDTGPAVRPAGMPVTRPPRVETMYCVMPTSRLLVGVSDAQRLKASIDQAMDGRGAPLDLPGGCDVAVRVKDLASVKRSAMLPPNAMGSDVVGVTATLTWTDKLAFNATLDMKDAEAAANFEQQTKAILQLLRSQTSQQPQSSSASGILDAVNVSVSGLQFRVGGSIPTSQLAALLPPSGPSLPMSPVPPAGVPGAMPMPGTPGGAGQPFAAPGSPPAR